MFTVSFLYVVAATRQAETFDAAVALGREAGFSFVVLDAANEIVASWCPIGGLRRRDPEPDTRRFRDFPRRELDSFADYDYE